MGMKKVRLLKNICYVTACALIVADCFLKSTQSRALWIAFFVGAVVFMLMGAVIHVQFYRCPHCKALLPNGRLPETCPSCGGELHD